MKVKILAGTARQPTLLKIRKLYLLRFERFDNLGAYSIPTETSLHFNSYFRACL